MCHALGESCFLASGGGPSSNSIEALFRHMDKDASGRITIDELREELREMLPRRRFQDTWRDPFATSSSGYGSRSSSSFSSSYSSNSSSSSSSGGGFCSPTKSDEPDAEALMFLLEDAECSAADSGASPLSESLCSKDDGERGMTLPEFARFIKKVRCYSDRSSTTYGMAQLAAILHLVCAS